MSGDAALAVARAPQGGGAAARPDPAAEGGDASSWWIAAGAFAAGLQIIAAAAALAVPASPLTQAAMIGAILTLPVLGLLAAMRGVAGERRRR